MSPVRVLIVDDDREVSTLIRMKLAREAPHFAIAVADGGMECLEYMKGHGVDCILSDYQMPVMDGMQLLKVLKAAGNTVPFIFVTGQGNEELAREAFKNGAYDYFTKDIGFAHFTRIINSVEQAVRHRHAEECRLMAEESLLEEKNKLDAVLASIGDGICITDRDFRVLYQNRSHKEMMGGHSGEYCYQAFQQKDGVCEGCPVARIFEEDGGVHTVEREGGVKGVTRRVEITASPLRDASGRVIAGIKAVRDITRRKQAETRLSRINDCLLGFGADPLENINRLTALCGELLGAACALYNRLDNGKLCSWGMWNAPPDFNPVDDPEGHICFDVIRQGGDRPVLLRNLQETKYARTDPNVLRYGLRTYLGQPVKFGGEPVGSMCVVFTDDFEPGAEDLKLIGVIASAVGVEETRNAAEKALEESERRLRDLLDKVHLVAVMLDTQGRITYCNDHLLNITGWRREEVIGRDWFDTFIPAGDRGELKGYFLEVLRQGEVPPHHENHITTRYGEPRYIFWSNTLLLDGQGNVIGTNSIGEDITERRRAEGELRESETRFRSLVEESLVGVYIIAQDGKFVYVNPRFAEIFGYSQAEITGRKMMLDLVNPADRQTVADNIRKRIDGEVESVHYQIQGLRKDGAAIEVEVYGSRTVYAGRPAVIGSLLDITGRKRAEEERSALFHMLSHDIKTPLTLIYGYGEMLFQQLKEGREAETVAEIKQAASRISMLIDDMLTLSAMDSGPAGLFREPLSLEDVLRQAVKDNMMPAHEAGVSIELKTAGHLPEVHADRVLLGRAMGNLVANAVKYNRPSGEVTVRAGVLPDAPGRVFVEVSDTGLGISDEDMPHVFERYYRGRKAGHRRGTGLGLAVVKAAVEAHGGTVSVMSAEKAGATFKVVLPVGEPLCQVTPLKSPS